MRNRRNIRGRQPNYSRRRRLFSVFLLVIAIVALTGGTYAWFSNNNTIDVTDLEIGVTPGSSLEISTDATKDSWKKVVNLEDIVNADYSYGTTRYNSYPTMYRPVSTIGTINNGFSEFFLGHISKAPTYEYTIAADSVEEVDGENGYLMSFDLYFKIGKEQNLYLNTTESHVNYIKLDTDTNDYQGIENAIRLGFVYEGYTSINDSIDNIQALKTTNADNIMIWEPNDDAHNQKAIEAAKEFYDLTITGTEVLDYVGIKTEIPENLHVPLKSTDPTYFESLGTKLMRSSKTPGGEFKMFKIKEGINKLRVYVWVEGQDVDCENAVSGTSFDIRINFNTRD